MSDRRPLTGAERQRRYRQRQYLGLRVISVELDDGDIVRLLDAGFLTERDEYGVQGIARAILRLVESLPTERPGYNSEK